MPGQIQLSSVPVHEIPRAKLCTSLCACRTASHPFAWCKGPEPAHKMCSAPATPLLGPAHQAQTVSTSTSRSGRRFHQASKPGDTDLTTGEREMRYSCSRSHTHLMRLGKLMEILSLVKIIWHILGSTTMLRCYLTSCRFLQDGESLLNC